MVPLLKHRLTRRVLYTLVFELVALNAVVLGILYARTEVWGAPSLNGKTFLFALSCTLLIQFGFWSFGLYSKQVIYSGKRVFHNLVGACCVLSVALFFLCYLFSLGGDLIFKPTLRFFPLLIASLFLVVVAVERFSILRIFRGDTHFGRMLFVGADQCTARVIREAREHLGDGIRIVGALGKTGAKEEDLAGDGDADSQASEASDGSRATCAGVPILGSIQDLEHVVRRDKIRTLVLCVPFDDPDLPLEFLLHCKMDGVTVVDAGGFYESVGQKILIEKLEPYSVLYPEGFTMSRLRWATKDIGERLLSALLLVALSLPLLMVWIAVRLSSKGPAIYTQTRVGKNGVPFTVYKFRTMAVDAEEKTGATFAQANDPRVTTVGKFLRRTRLDELPQLINVLKGDMAFVGPRPERPEFVEDLQSKLPFYKHRHFVKPGLTGWAQVSYGYGRHLDDSREKLRYDLYYVKNMSLFFDAIIALATVRAVVRGSGM